DLRRRRRHPPRLADLPEMGRGLSLGRGLRPDLGPAGIRARDLCPLRRGADRLQVYRLLRPRGGASPALERSGDRRRVAGRRSDPLRQGSERAPARRVDGPAPALASGNDGTEMRILLTGAGGQLGRSLPAVLAGHDVTALSHAELAIDDLAAVRRAVAQHRPELVLNSAAYNQVDAAESDPEAAYRGNALG